MDGGTITTKDLPPLAPDVKRAAGTTTAGTGGQTQRYAYLWTNESVQVVHNPDGSMTATTASGEEIELNV